MGETRASQARRGSQRALQGLGLCFRQAAYWAPVLLALAFLAHVANKSLTPALREQRRLEASDAQMRARELEQLERQGLLETQLEALEDPIYQERVRRLEHQTESAPAKVNRPVPFSEASDH